MAGEAGCVEAAVAPEEDGIKCDWKGGEVGRCLASRGNRRESPLSLEGGREHPILVVGSGLVAIEGEADDSFARRPAGTWSARSDIPGAVHSDRA